MPIEYIFLGRKPLWWLCGTATLTISFCPFAFTGKVRALIYVIDLQFQCSVVTFQVLRKCAFWPLQRPIEYIFLRRQPLWWLCGTATLTISFLLLCFYRQGAGPDLCYRYLHLQFRCSVVTYQT